MNGAADGGRDAEHPPTGEYHPPRSPAEAIATTTLARRIPFLIALACLVSACALSTPKPSAPAAPAKTTAPAASAFEHAVEHGTVIVSAQPTLADLQSLSQRGVQRVFNLRTDEEMAPAELGYDEADVLAKNGIAYGRAPVAGASGFNPEALEQFRRFMESGQGKVVLHCASGARASQLFAAYEVKYLGKSPDEALRGLAPFGGWPLPLERMTGIPLTVDRKDSADGFEEAKH